MGSKHGRTRQQLTLAQRRKRVARLYASGMIQEEIATALDVSQATISRDIAAVEEDWRAEAAQDLAELKAAELGGLREMERIAATKLAATGEVAWLREWLKIKARIAKLLGLDEASRMQLQHSWLDEVPAEWQGLAQEFFQSDVAELAERVDDLDA